MCMNRSCPTRMLIHITHNQDTSAPDCRKHVAPGRRSIRLNEVVTRPWSSSVIRGASSPSRLLRARRSVLRILRKTRGKPSAAKVSAYAHHAGSTSPGSDEETRRYWKHLGDGLLGPSNQAIPGNQQVSRSVPRSVLGRRTCARGGIAVACEVDVPGGSRPTHTVCSVQWPQSRRPAQQQHVRRESRLRGIDGEVPEWCTLSDGSLVECRQSIR